MNNRILTLEQAQQKIKRIAYEIYERNFEEKEIVLAGIVEEGYTMASLLAEHLRTIAPCMVTLMKIQLNKERPHAHAVLFDRERDSLEGKVIIVIDDVLNTGRTLAYGLSPFLGVSIKRLQVAVMVNRAHHTFPISADYVGYTLSTTLNEHVQVKLSGDEAGVYLS
ncbi:MAG: phosphoribosyltransferase family protein [Runella sp.]